MKNSHQAQRVTVNVLYTTWMPVTSGVPQVPILRAMLFNMFTNYVKETKFTFSRFISISSGNAVNAPKSSVAIQGDLNRVEEWAEQENFMKFTTHN